MLQKNNGPSEASDCKAPRVPTLRTRSIPPELPPTSPSTSHQDQSRSTLNDVMIKRDSSSKNGEGNASTNKTHNNPGHHHRLLQSINTNSSGSKINFSSASGTQQNNSNHGGSRANLPGSGQSNCIGNYELLKTLGKGNFATVKLAKHKITHHTVAIKIIKLSSLNEDNLMKVNREIEIMKKLGRHKHIVRLYQVMKTRRYYFLVTDYCAKGELYEYIIDRGKLKEPQSCKYFTQILSAIEYLHDHNVVHRDLKAENLLLTDDFETIKLADFGFANYYKQDDLLSTWCGSPPYAAPELFQGVRYVGPQVDIWSLGVVLYVLVCGSLPFDGHNLVELKERVLTGKFRIPFFMSSECESLVRGMLRLDPEKRFGTKHIRSHTWMLKHSSTNSNEPATRDPCDSGPARKSAQSADVPNASSTMDIDKDKTTSRGQSLDLDDGKKVVAKNSNEDASMSSLTCCAESSDKRLVKLASSRMSPADIRNLVDTDIVNAVSNMSIDSTNSSQGIDAANTGNGGRSGHNSSLSSSRYSNPRADSSCCSSFRQFSKESSIDDQIIDFMVENLKVTNHQNSIRESIANERYDDLHAIYKLLRDQPDMVLESKFKKPPLPLLPPSKNKASRNHSITTGFFNFAQVDSVNRLADSSPKTETKSDENKLAHKKCSDGDTVVMNLTKRNSNNEAKDLIHTGRGVRTSEDLSWTMPPQLFLTPPIEGRCQQLQQVDQAVQVSGQGISADSRHYVARRSFDSTLNDRPDCINYTLDQTFRTWDSSTMDPLSLITTPNTPAGPEDGSISTSFSDTHYTTQGGPLKLGGNLATITTNLPQIGIQTGVNAANVLRAHLNLSGCGATMSQSESLIQNESSEQRLQQTTPWNNLVNQNYNVLDNLQNSLKITGAQNLTLLNPNCLLSGLERRASDGQASYSSLTASGSDERALAASDVVHQPQIANDRGDNHCGSPFSNPLSSHSQSSDHYGYDINSCNTISSQPANQSNNADAEHTACDEFTSRANYINGPLDLSNKAPQDGPSYADFDSFQRDDRQMPNKINSQRSNSTTSDTVSYFPNLLPASATTSPRSSIFAPIASHGQSSIPSCRVSPSSLSLSGGGTGHLLNRRKRHSLDTESRHLHGHPHNHHNSQPYSQQRSIYQPQYNYLNFSANSHHRKVNDMLNGDANRSPRHANNLPNLGPTYFGALKNFPQMPMSQMASSSSSGWATPRSPATSTTVDMDTSGSQDAGLSSNEKFFA